MMLEGQFLLLGSNVIGSIHTGNTKAMVDIVALHYCRCTVIGIVALHYCRCTIIGAGLPAACDDALGHSVLKL